MRNPHTPELKSLRLAAKVVESAGIAAAARQLGMSQPALSRAIRELEERLGFALFERNVRGAKPTEAAKVLIDGIRPAFRAIDDAVMLSRQVAEGKAGTLRFGLMETVSWGGILPDVIARFRADCPNVELAPVPLHSTEQLRDIEDGRLDVGSVYYRPDEPHKFEFLPLSVDPIALCVHKDDTGLANLPEPVALSALQGAQLIWFERYQSPSYHDRMLAALEHAGVSAVPARVVKTTSTMLALVNVGCGYTFMPASAGDRKPPDVLFKVLERADLAETLMLAWRAGTSNPAIGRLTACARAVLADGAIAEGSSR